MNGLLLTLVAAVSALQAPIRHPRLQPAVARMCASTELPASGAAVHGLHLAAPIRHLRLQPSAARMCATASTELSASGVAGILRRGVFGRLRSTWARCTNDVCDVEWRPFERVRRLIPRKRPLRRLRMCEEGTYKVRRMEGVRRFEFTENLKECSVDGAMDML